MPPARRPPPTRRPPAAHPPPPARRPTRRPTRPPAKNTKQQSSRQRVQFSTTACSGPLGAPPPTHTEGGGVPSGAPRRGQRDPQHRVRKRPYLRRFQADPPNIGSDCLHTNRLAMPPIHDVRGKAPRRRATPAATRTSQLESHWFAPNRREEARSRQANHSGEPLS